MPDKNLLYDIEVVYLKRLASLLRKGTIDRTKAQDMARAFIDLLPFLSIDDLHTKIKEYLKKYPDMDTIEMPILERKDKEDAGKKAEEVLESIQH